MRKGIRFLGGLALFLVVTALALAFVPMPIPSIAPGAKEREPGFAEALERASGEQNSLPPPLNPVCAAKVLHHGKPTRKVFLLLHGLSNCPAQFAELGKQLHAMGHTVVIPRMPFHGHKDRLTPDYRRLNLRRLSLWVRESLEWAHGLGEEVIVAGLSVNGVTAAWIAQERGDVRRCLVLAPFLAPAGISLSAALPIGRALARSPNVFLWWNAELREANPGPPHAYPRFPTQVIGNFLVLGAHVLARAQKFPPACPQIAVVCSEADSAISIPAVRELASGWMQNGAFVEEVWFPAGEKIPHDFIDPSQPNQKTGNVYPRLLQLLTTDTWPPQK